MVQLSCDVMSMPLLISCPHWTWVLNIKSSLSLLMNPWTLTWVVNMKKCITCICFLFVRSCCYDHVLFAVAHRKIALKSRSMRLLWARRINDIVTENLCSHSLCFPLKWAYLHLSFLANWEQVFNSKIDIVTRNYWYLRIPKASVRQVN